ncbi:unnamed protein product [Blumeria hordei]|uniref:non-specific serine/threonine protein kinase n=1 Tax=Blumeria hordei TaxID=2867405 RepID=A0A383UYP5_BLUHO|nr:unnamed protein product [Blumeria hordei]
MSKDSGTLTQPWALHLQTQPSSVGMERSFSIDIQEEREDLKEAAEQTLNVILDLGMDGVIQWVSPSWTNVIGTTLESVQGKPIKDLLVSENKSIFSDAMECMKKDNSRSQFIRFSVRLGPASKLAPFSDPEKWNDNAFADTSHEDLATLNLEGQGILVNERASDQEGEETNERGGETHTMWMIRPWIPPREIQIDLPTMIVESLGSGAEVLASYLTQLSDPSLEDPSYFDPPLPVLCRICECQIPPWWFEKHSELCLQEHKAEMEVQICQENLTEHRHAIVKVLDALETKKSESTSEEQSVQPVPQAEYKGMTIGPSSPITPTSSGSTSLGLGRSRDLANSGNGFGHSRTKSFAVRRPLARIVELLLDLCDTSLEISTPAIKEAASQTPGEFRVQSPQSEGRISQVMQWQSPSTNTLDQEQGLATLCADTERVAKAKIEAVLRYRSIIEYTERIRIEFSMMVQECIDEAIQKALRLSSGNYSESEYQEEDDYADDNFDNDEQIAMENRENEEENVTRKELNKIQEKGFFTGSFNHPIPLGKCKEINQENNREFLLSPTTITTAKPLAKSGSPKEYPIPRSPALQHNLNLRTQESRRQSFFHESDVGDSDGSLKSSSINSRPARLESPVSEFGNLRRATSSRQRNRRSVVIPGTSSPHRQESPVRVLQPSSPLRISKPRSLVVAHEGIISPAGSPMLSNSELSSPLVHLPHHQHRRQSSVPGVESSRPPPSPRLSSVNAPQVRAVPPSIKDFEIIKPISKGAFGSVYLAKKKTTGDYYAIKVLKKADMVAKNQVTNVKAERAIMMWQGESEFVAKLYWTFSSKDYLYLVMEYLNGGDCASLIKVLGGLSEEWAKKYLGEVILGVKHLHSRGIVHRDLKPDNLLIDQKGHLKLTDFGLSRMGLIGRQKRVLDSNANDSTPDLLKQGPFTRAASLSSSRSTSIDFQGFQSPSPPTNEQNMITPSYFNLNRDGVSSRKLSRRPSGWSESSDNLHRAFSSFSLEDQDSTKLVKQRRIEEASGYACSPPSQLSQHSLNNHHNSEHKNNTPSNMMPLPMALFDPDDSNRRFVGTPDYLAPETIKGIGQDETSDWWSVGCILFEFLYGYPPFHAGTPDEVFENILARKICWPDVQESDVSVEAKDLMNRLLCLDPTSRLGANAHDRFPCGGDEVQAHCWFENVDWDKLLEDEAQFVPAPENPEDTEYFDTRGAILQSFAEEMEDQSSPQSTAPASDYQERPHDALSRVRSPVASIKRNMVPLHIPPHVRDSKSRRLSEPIVTDDFGNFTFKNLPVLEKANKDVIQRLRAQAIASQLKSTCITPQASGSSIHSATVSDGTQPLQSTLQRTLSGIKVSSRSSSPSGLSQSNSSPNRTSQPSSPLLVSFVAGHTDNRRKVSNPSSSLANQAVGSLNPVNIPENCRVLTHNQKSMSALTSPTKSLGKTSLPLPPVSPPKVANPTNISENTYNRSRSMTIESQESNGPSFSELYSAHRKRRSQVFEMSPSSSDNEGDKESAFLRVQRRRQSSRRLSQVTFTDGPIFRPLDVLICEDHPVSRMVMEKLLEKLRCRSITVSNGAEAMRYAMSEIKFDIILMEFKLPQINGADVARMIRDTKNANSHTPIVAVTGYLKDLQAPHQFDALIEKPPTTLKLTEIMSHLCQWKAPTAGQGYPSPMGYPQLSSLRWESRRFDDSPTSGSSGSAYIPSSSLRSSSQGNSISSSMCGDDSGVYMSDHVPIIVNRRATGSWEGTAGLGIKNEDVSTGPRDYYKPFPPPNLHYSSLRGNPETGFDRSTQRFGGISKERGKKYQHHEPDCIESEDDEGQARDLSMPKRCPRGKAQSHTHRESKLGIEMMRTNSRGSVVSVPDLNPNPEIFNYSSLKEEASFKGTECARLLSPKSSFTGTSNANQELQKTPHHAPLKPVTTDELTPRGPSNLSSQSQRNNTHGRRR